MPEPLSAAGIAEGRRVAVERVLNEHTALRHPSGVGWCCAACDWRSEGRAWEDSDGRSHIYHGPEEICVHQADVIAHLPALLDAAEKAAESSDRQKAMRLAEHGPGHTPQERWRDASRAARVSEHHWPADCLAEAADVLDSLLEERAAVRALANRWATRSNDYDEDTEQQIEDGREILELLGEEVDSDAQ